MQTVRDAHNKFSACSGWAIWIAGGGTAGIAIAWPWAFIEPGVPAIDTMQIQSNLLLLDAAERPLPEYQALGVLVHVVNSLDWHTHARKVCSEPYHRGATRTDIRALSLPPTTVL